MEGLFLKIRDSFCFFQYSFQTLQFHVGRSSQTRKLFNGCILIAAIYVSTERLFGEDRICHGMTVNGHSRKNILFCHICHSKGFNMQNFDIVFH